MGLQVSVYDECISAALRKLPDKKRNVILMLFFLDMRETEICCLFAIGTEHSTLS